MEIGAYAIARDLRGFGIHTSLRVRVRELRDGHAWIVTADLASAGVPLVINAAQLEPLEPAAPAHSDSGLHFPSSPHVVEWYRPGRDGAGHGGRYHFATVDTARAEARRLRDAGAQVRLRIYTGE